MLRKLHAFSLVLVLAAGLFGFNRSGPVPARAAAPAESLLSLLPASDFVAYGDARQVFDVVLPAIAAQKPERQSQIDRDLSEFQRETGIDPRSFDSVAVGVQFNGAAAGSQPNFVAIARGSFDAAAAIDTAIATQAKKANSTRVKKTIEYAGHQIFVSVRPDADGGNRSSNNNDREIAALVIDTNTVAVGDLASMRAVVDAANGKGRVDDELIALATRTSGAIAGFAGTVPGTMSNLIIGGHGGDNEIGRAISSVKQVYGSVTSAGSDFDSRLTIRTDNADQASHLGQMINALKLFAKASDNNNSGQRSAQSLLHDLNVTVEGNEIDLTLHASLTDLMGVAHHF